MGDKAAGPPDDPRRRQDPEGELEGEDVDIWRRAHARGQHPGEGYTRIRREDLGEFRRASGDRLVATDKTGEASGGATGLGRHVQTFLTGRPLDTEALETERLSILRALPILSSDALSSVAYGPEAGLSVLAAASTTTVPSGSRPRS